MLLKTAREHEYKEQHYQEMQTIVSKLTDKLGQGMDAGIAETVVFLNLLGITTSQSCEGHLEHGTGAPWVDIEDESVNGQCEEATKLFKLATQRKQQLGSINEEILQLFEQAHQARLAVKRKHINLRQRLLSLLAAFYGQRQVAFDIHLVIQARVDGKSRLESQGADMQDVLPLEQRQQKLQVYQQEMQAFTAFLKHLYFAQEELAAPL